MLLIKVLSQRHRDTAHLANLPAQSERRVLELERSVQSMRQQQELLQKRLRQESQQKRRLETEMQRRSHRVKVCFCFLGVVFSYSTKKKNCSSDRHTCSLLGTWNQEWATAKDSEDQDRRDRRLPEAETQRQQRFCHLTGGATGWVAIILPELALNFHSLLMKAHCRCNPASCLSRK